MKDEFFAIHDQSMASIISTLKTDNTFCITGQKVDDFPLPSSPHWVPTTTTLDISYLLFTHLVCIFILYQKKPHNIKAHLPFVNGQPRQYSQTTNESQSFAD